MNPLTAFGYTKHGLKHDPRGAQVSCKWQGKTLLGDVTGVYRDPRGMWHLQVRHFNGDLWPIDPALSAVDVLERREAEPKKYYLDPTDGWQLSQTWLAWNALSGPR